MNFAMMSSLSLFLLRLVVDAAEPWSPFGVSPTSGRRPFSSRKDCEWETRDTAGWELGLRGRKNKPVWENVDQRIEATNIVKPLTPRPSLKIKLAPAGPLWFRCE